MISTHAWARDHDEHISSLRADRVAAEAQAAV
jgi:hypothetical protein